MSKAFGPKGVRARLIASFQLPAHGPAPPRNNGVVPPAGAAERPRREWGFERGCIRRSPQQAEHHQEIDGGYWRPVSCRRRRWRWRGQFVRHPDSTGRNARVATGPRFASRRHRRCRTPSHQSTRPSTALWLRS